MRVSRRTALATAAAAPFLAAAPARAETGYLVGVGMSDVTGPAAECGMMGYSQFEQRTAGIHLRTRARAFIVVDRPSGARVCFMTADTCMIFGSVHRAVIAELTARFGGLYTEQNVLLTATHSHAACGGSAHDLAYNLSVMGFQRQTFEAEVDGIVEAITRAHQDLGAGTLALGRAELHDASVNRSRVAFDRNPAADKAAFPAAIDPAVTTIALRKGGHDVGVITWFATHNTSMSNKNLLISGDNKGYASFAFEQANGVDYLGAARFVAAFPQTNAGDMSPNLNLRPASGPTDDEFDNTRIIGERQYAAAKKAVAQANPISGAVGGALCYIDLADVAVDGQFTPDGRPGHTTPACIGAALAAGSVEDGPGTPLPIPEGLTAPAWLTGAQAPKLIVAPVGIMPGGWVPNIVPIQVLRIGPLYLAAAGAEFTIVAGLRIRRTVARALGVPLENVLMQGYANTYHQYVTTPEEYEAQQYEGGSTLFGRYTLPAYMQEFHRLATAFAAGRSVSRGPAPVDNAAGQASLAPPPPPDAAPPGRAFGDVLLAPAGTYSAGQRVTVEFVSGHPANNLRRNATFAEIQRRDGSTWKRVAHEGQWPVIFRWQRRGPAESVARFEWTIPAGTPRGTYRVQHFGDVKDAGGAVRPVLGTTPGFDVG